jgi:hypothetical protein
MAEVFGVAAGAIGVVSLSIQLAESLQKVKRFYGAVKNAPPQVEELVEEIEIMQDILSDLELGSQSAIMASSASMRRRMKVAQRATQSFVAFSEELQKRIKKSRFRGGVKFALSRDDIKQMLDQLERTKSSLNLAYSLYQQATAEDRHAAIISAVSSSQGVSVGTAQNIITRNASQTTKTSPLSGRKMFRMTTPEWMSNTIRQFEMRRSIAGFNIALRTYTIVSWDAPIVGACRKGDLVEMQWLFDNRLASPFDNTEIGIPVWEVSSKDTKACDRSTDVEQGCRYVCSCRHPPLPFPIRRRLKRSRRVRIGKCTAPSRSICNPSDASQTSLVTFHVNAQLMSDREPFSHTGRCLREDLIWLRNLLVDTIDDVPESECWFPNHERIMRLIRCSPEDADSIWFWQYLEFPRSRWHTPFPDTRIKVMLDRYKPEHHGGKAPLHLALVSTAFHMVHEEPKGVRSLMGIVIAIMAAGTGLHAGEHHHTPLLLLFASIPASSHFDPHICLKPRNLRRVLVMWLKVLQKSGVDLVAYGAEESRQHLLYRSLKDTRPPLTYWCNMEPCVFSDEVFYFTFSYGPTPEDWRVELDPTIDQFVGEFWQMPGLLDDYEIRAMPGGWIDKV